MFKPGDPILKRHSQKVRKLEAKYPNRDWRFNLSEKQIKEVEEWRKEPEKIKIPELE